MGFATLDWFYKPVTREVHMFYQTDTHAPQDPSNMSPKIGVTVSLTLKNRETLHWEGDVNSGTRPCRLIFDVVLKRFCPLLAHRA